MGFSRIILARELSITDIARIRREVPDIELEVFVHGAMCLAYSGRCYLSAYMSDRSANKGGCAHSCRWGYRVLEEEKRPGEYYPVIEGDGFSTILSSKDLCMIDHLQDLEDAGVDSCKIEGRMKSIYYVAVVTRAYRKALDAQKGAQVPDLERFIEELDRVSHREYSTGFFFDKDEIEIPARTSYVRTHLLMGSFEEHLADHRYVLNVKNRITVGEPLECIGPDEPGIQLDTYRIYDTSGTPVEYADHRDQYVIETDAPVGEGYILRKPWSA
jgi:putative protease